MDKKGVSIFSLGNVLSHSAEKIRSGDPCVSELF